MIRPPVLQEKEGKTGSPPPRAWPRISTILADAIWVTEDLTTVLPLLQVLFEPVLVTGVTGVTTDFSPTIHTFAHSLCRRCTELPTPRHILAGSPGLFVTTPAPPNGVQGRTQRLPQAPCVAPLREASAELPTLSLSEPKCSGHWGGHTPLTTSPSSRLPCHLETNTRPLSHPHCQKGFQAHVPSPCLPGRANRIQCLAAPAPMLHLCPGFL